MARLQTAVLLQNYLCQWKKITVPNFSQVSLCQRLSLIHADMLKNTSWGTIFKITFASNDLVIILFNINQFLLTEMVQKALTDAHQLKYQRVVHLTRTDGKQQYRSISQFYEGETNTFICNYVEQVMGLPICFSPCAGQNRSGAKKYSVGKIYTVSYSFTSFCHQQSPVLNFSLTLPEYLSPCINLQLSSAPVFIQCPNGSEQ